MLCVKSHYGSTGDLFSHPCYGFDGRLSCANLAVRLEEAYSDNGKDIFKWILQAAKELRLLDKSHLIPVSREPDDLTIFQQTFDAIRSQIASDEMTNGRA